MSKRKTQMEQFEAEFEASQIAAGYMKCNVCRSANWTVWHSPKHPCTKQSDASTPKTAEEAST